jgi:hypothetical protein
MSDWLERELTRGLAAVPAPELLATRLGFAPARRWEFPRVPLAVAAAVVLIIAGGFAAGQSAALDLRREARVNGSVSGAEAGARPLRCDGGAASPAAVNAARPTVLLAHYAVETPVHAPVAAADAGCHFCHSL